MSRSALQIPPKASRAGDGPVVPPQGHPSTTVNVFGTWRRLWGAIFPRQSSILIKAHYRWLACNRVSHSTSEVIYRLFALSISLAATAAREHGPIDKALSYPYLSTFLTRPPTPRAYCDDGPDGKGKQLELIRSTLYISAVVFPLVLLTLVLSASYRPGARSVNGVSPVTHGPWFD